MPTSDQWLISYVIPVVAYQKKIKSILHAAFNRLTWTLDLDYRDGLAIAAKAALQHRWFLVGLFFCNLGAGVLEGGTMGILAIAVSVLVEQQSASDLSARFGFLESLFGGKLFGVGPGGLFLLLVLFAVVAQVLKSLMMYLGKYYSIRLQFKVSRDLQERSTNQVMAYSYQEVTKVAAGSLSGLINEAARISGMVGLINRVALAIVMFVSYFVVMLLLSIPLALSAIAIMICVWFGISRVIGRLRELGRKAVLAGLQTSKVSFEFLNAPRLLRVYGVTDVAGKQINAARNETLQADERAERVKAAVDPSMDALTIVSVGGFLVVGYFLSGAATLVVIPKLLLFLLVLNRMMPQARAVNEIRMALARSMHGIGIAGSFLRTTDKRMERADGETFTTLSKGIRFENVSFAYPGTQEFVLKDLTFNILKGETIAFVGASGGGKSTIVSLLLGLYEPTHGRITVDDIDLNQIQLKSWRAKCGTVDQDVFLLNASIAENIAFLMSDYTIDDIVNVARLAYAHDFVKALPEGYDTVIGDKGYRLSGGQKQRIALARSLMRSPEVLVLDEATSALDSESERFIQKTLHELHKSMTIVVIAHRFSTIANADQIIVLENGRIAEKGVFSELSNADGRFERLWELQAIRD